MREPLCLRDILLHRELFVKGTRYAQEIHRRRRVAEVERRDEQAAVEQETHRTPHPHIVKRRARPVHCEIAHHDGAARRDSEPLILRQLVSEHGRHRIEIEYAHDLLCLQRGESDIGARDAAHHDAVRTRLRPVVVLVALQEDVLILHIFDDTERPRANRHAREISIVRKAGRRIDRAAEIHHIVELIDVRLRERHAHRQIIDGLCAHEIRIVVLSAA